MSTKVKSNQSNRHSVKADVSGSAFVEISSLYFWSDWTTIEKNKIDLTAIIGFIIHWRGDGWHVEVKTKEKIGEYEYRSYELSHCVYPKQIAEIIANKDCKIIAFKNTHNSNNFIDHLNKVLKWADSLS
jgi:hypothetical protein